VNPVSQFGGISHPPVTARASVFSSPNSQRETSAGAPAGSPRVTVRGTLYSGPSGLWKNFFKAATAKPVSVSGSPRHTLPQGEEQMKERSGTLRAELPSGVVSQTRASPPREKLAGIDPVQLGVVGSDSPSPSEKGATSNVESDSSVFATGELLNLIR